MKMKENFKILNSCFKVTHFHVSRDDTLPFNIHSQLFYIVISNIEYYMRR